MAYRQVPERASGQPRWDMAQPRSNPVAITAFQNWQSTWATILRDPNAACPWEDKCGAFLYPVGETIPRKFKCSACHKIV